jgi:hypothetical protein
MKGRHLGQIGIAGQAYSRPNWYASSVVVSLCSPLIHCLFCIAFANNKFLRHASLNIIGAMSLGRWPSSQRSFQKLICLSLPTTMLIHARNKAVSVSLRHTGILDQGLCGSFHFSPCYRSRRALLNFLRSRISRPPFTLGIKTRFQLT